MKIGNGKYTMRFASSWLLVMLFFLALFTGGCAKRGVIVSSEKFSSEWIVLGDPECSSRQRLCEFDLEHILLLTPLSPYEQAEMRSLICGADNTAEAFYRFYSALDGDVKAEIVRAFELYDYHIHGYG